MKRNIRGLFVSFLMLYFVFDPLRMILQGGGLDSILSIDLPTSYFMFVCIIVFFMMSCGTYLALYSYYSSRQHVKILVIILMSFLLPSLLRYFLDQFVANSVFDMTNYRKGVDIGFYLKDQVYFFIIYAVLGTIFFFTTFSRYKSQQELLLRQENQKMELSLLRSQINPHFLLNSMNNIYSLVFMKSDKALVAIDKLSEILKYTLYENDEMVPISKVADYLANYITLQSMRYEQKPHVEIEINPLLRNHNIPPFLLVPLVENAFKHGDLHNEETPMRIRIDKENEFVAIVISNKVNVQEKDTHGGIGLNNVQKRLELLYGEKHTFTKTEQEHIFEVSIKIPLK